MQVLGATDTPDGLLYNKVYLGAGIRMAREPPSMAF